jgi:hypothetical protein
VPNIDGLVWFGYLTHVSEDISAQHTLINLPTALLEPVAKPVVLNTIKPLFENNFFWPEGWVGLIFGGKKI